MTSFTVRQVTPDEATDALRAEITDVLATSFLTYRPWTGVWSADPDISHFVFASAVTHAFADGWEVWTASEHERIIGVALWLPPGVDESIDFFLAGLSRIPASLAEHAMTAVVPEYMGLSAILPNHAKEWWYLHFLGTLPSAKGRGVGSALLDAGLKRAGGTPLALTTGTDDNEQWYAKRGYAVRGDIKARLLDGWVWRERLMTLPADAVPVGEEVKLN